MAVFRIEKTRDYTVMSNHHLRDKSLSLKAKGLLSLMLSLPEEWDYTTKGLARICKDGVDSICAGVRELEEHGYVIRQRVRNANGQLGAIEYTILEQPRPPEPKPRKPERENPVLDNPEQALPVLGEPEQENPAQLNTKNQVKINQKKIYQVRKDQILSYQAPKPPGARIGPDGIGCGSERAIGNSFWRTSSMTSSYRMSAWTVTVWMNWWSSWWTRSAPTER